MKIALIGARGQLGADMVRTRPDDVDLVPLNRGDVDITNRERVKVVLREIRPDAVINTAAYVRVDDAEDNSEVAFRANASGVKNIAEGCHETGSVVLHVSTDYVFDGKDRREPYHEMDIPNPINVYGISKYAGELFIRNYLDKYYIARSSSLYGKAGASGKGGNFVYTVLEKAKKGERLKVVADVYMSPTYTYDLANALWSILLEKRPYGMYHVTNAGYCSWYEFAKKIIEYSGLACECSPVSSNDYETRAKRPPWSVLSSKRGIQLRRWDLALRDFVKESGHVLR